MQAIVTWECGGVGATCVACAIIPRGGGARAHATRVRSHAGTGDGVAARSECRDAIGRGKSRARRAFLNRRFWVHAARGGRTASSGAREIASFVWHEAECVFSLEKVYVFPDPHGSLPMPISPSSRVPRIRLDKSRARASVPRSIPPPRDSSPRVLSARRLRRLAIRVGSARRPGRGSRSASGPERASSSRASRDPRASRSPFRRKRQTGRWREVSLDDQINRASEASAERPVAPRPLPSLARAMASPNLARARPPTPFARLGAPGSVAVQGTPPPRWLTLLDRLSHANPLEERARGPAANARDPSDVAGVSTTQTTQQTTTTTNSPAAGAAHTNRMATRGFLARVSAERPGPAPAEEDALLAPAARSLVVPPSPDHEPRTPVAAALAALRAAEAAKAAERARRRAERHRRRSDDADEDGVSDASESDPPSESFDPPSESHPHRKHHRRKHHHHHHHHHHKHRHHRHEHRRRHRRRREEDEDEEDAARETKKKCRAASDPSSDDAPPNFEDASAKNDPPGGSGGGASERHHRALPRPPSPSPSPPDPSSAALKAAATRERRERLEREAGAGLVRVLSQTGLAKNRSCDRLVGLLEDAYGTFLK